MTKQTNPIYEERERGVAFMEIGMEILQNARNELYLAMRFLDVSLSALTFLPRQQISLLGTDGSALYFQPDALVSCFRKGRVYVNRAYLHSILHCLFGHLWHRKDRDAEYWNLACDIAAEYVLDGLNVRAVHVPKSMFRRSIYRKLREPYTVEDSLPETGRQVSSGFPKAEHQVSSGFPKAEHQVSSGFPKAERQSSSDFSKAEHQTFSDVPKAGRHTSSGFTVTAERVYQWLCRMHLPQPEIDRLSREFTVDDHSMWQQDDPSSRPQPEQQRWDDIRDRMQTEMETFSKEASDDVKSLTEQVEIENRERYDYREFLQKFAVLKEELQVDMDSFDYIFYHYGMSLYGNMPLIEPLETKEVRRVEDFVIVIDTSMSCKGELVRRFLEETCTILQESDSFSRRIHIRILQCDDKVQEDIRITNPQELHDYMSHFTVKGLGGTDFRPAFAYVEELKRQKVFTKLRGLIYFTDGYGTFPVKKPDYETAFVFLKEDYRDVDVPPWAIKLILEPEQI